MLIGPRRRALIALAAATTAVTALAVDAVPVRAAVVTWTGAGSDALWSDLGNWQNAVPPTNGSSVDIPAGTKAGTVNISVSLVSLTVESACYQLSSSGPGTLTISSVINYGDTCAGVFAVPLTLGSATVTATSLGGITFGGSISEAAAGDALVLNGGGTFQFNAPGSWSGGTTISASLAQVNNPNGSLGSGPITVSSGATFADMTNAALANAVSIAGSGVASPHGALEGVGDLTGPITLTADAVVSCAFGGLTLDGAISGAHLLHVAYTCTSGQVGLNGTNTYGGGTILSSTGVKAQNTSAFGTGAVTASSSSILLQPNGTITNALIDNGAVSLVSASGTNTWSGTITVATLNDNLSLAVTFATIAISGVVSGPGGVSVVQNVGGTVDLGGTSANTFTGPTQVTQGTLTLTSSNGVAATSTNVFVGDSVGAASSATLLFTSGNELPAAATITVNTDGAVDLSSNAQTAAALVMTGPASVDIPSGGGDLNVPQITTLASTVAAAITGAGVISSGTGFTLDVADGAAAQDLQIAPGLFSASGLIKTGPGTAELSGNPIVLSYGVQAGTLLVDGTATAGLGASVSSGAILGGSGTVATAVTVASGGALSPGDSPGTINVAPSLTLSPGSHLAEEIAGPSASGPTQYDQTLVATTATLTGSILDVVLTYTPAQNATFTIIQTAAPVAGTFAGLPEGAHFTVNTTEFAITYMGGLSGHHVVLTALGTATTTVLGVSPATSALGTPVTLTATVTGAAGSGPTGTVTFFDGATSIGSGPLNGAGVATLTTSALSQGTHTLTAVYGGDTSYAGSTSAPVAATVTIPVPATGNPQPAADHRAGIVGALLLLVGAATTVAARRTRRRPTTLS